MKTLQEWFEDYAVSHQNETNIKIHFICVPVIFFSIVGILMSIPSGIISETLGISNPIIANWAAVIMIPVLIFYLRLSFSMFLKMLFFSALCLVGNYYLSLALPLFLTSLAIFVAAWVGQFYGHHVEGKKPSFLKDLQFLLIGPAWVFEKMLR